MPVIQRARVQGLEPYTWTEEDRAAFLDAVSALGTTSEDLLAILGIESAFTYNPHVAFRNSSGYPSAVGLNQITETNAKAMGISEEERLSLLDMTVAEQMPYIVRSFQAANRGKAFVPPVDAVTLYQLNAAPATVGREVLYTQKIDPCPPANKTSDPYCGNPALDVDKDGQITRSDLAAVLERAKARKEYKAMLALIGSTSLPSRASAGLGGAVILAAGAGALWFWSRKSA